MNKSLLYIGLALAIGMLIGMFLPVAPAQSQENLALHQIGGVDGVKVLKMVHYGCEIYVAIGGKGNDGHSLTGEYPTPIAITTGRNCK